MLYAVLNSLIVCDSVSVHIYGFSRNTVTLTKNKFISSFSNIYTSDLFLLSNYTG